MKRTAMNRDSANKGGLIVRRHPEGVVFKVFVQPKSSKNAVVGLHGDALKIKLTAPPVDNAANAMCVKFLAKVLSVSKSSVEIIAGHTSRNKQVLLKADQRSTAAGEYKHLEQLVEKLAGCSREFCAKGQKDQMIKT
ncbi:MAG: DUF167 domain-containing protein [Desulfobacterales bacterium]